MPRLTSWTRLILATILFCILSRSTWGAPCSKELGRLVPDHQRRGMSVIEVLVVVGVFGTLTALLLPSISKSRIVARNAQCLAHLNQAYAITLEYENTYQSIPVTTLTNSPNPFASVDFSQTFDLEPEILRKTFRCPQDRGRPIANSDAILFYSYKYRGLEAMISRTNPRRYDTRNARLNYEADLAKALYYRLPLWQDYQSFHGSRSREAPFDGWMNAAYYDGSVRRVPKMPP